VRGIYDFRRGDQRGIYDFRRGDQRGIDPLGSVLVRWDKAAHDFIATSKPGGAPL
jgi:hypothetical protein